MSNNNYLEIVGNVGINCHSTNCMAIHPSEMHMFYSVGSLLVVKSVDSDNDKYLQGHAGLITFITVSKSGNLLASGE